MTKEEIIETLEDIKSAFYMISVALVSISEFENCNYGFQEEIDIAKKFIEDYERNEDL